MCVVQCLSGLMQDVTLPIQDLGVSMTGRSPHRRLLDRGYTVLWHHLGKGGRNAATFKNRTTGADEAGVARMFREL